MRGKKNLEQLEKDLQWALRSGYLDERTAEDLRIFYGFRAGSLGGDVYGRD